MFTLNTLLVLLLQSLFFSFIIILFNSKIEKISFNLKAVIICGFFLFFVRLFLYIHGNLVVKTAQKNQVQIEENIKRIERNRTQ